MVLTEEAQADQYPAASMEDAAATAEETYYSNLNTTRVASPSGYPANTPAGNAKVARVSGGTNPADHKIGPAILLKVMSGDKFNVSVNSWWKKDAGTPVNSPNSAGAGLLEALINGVSGLGGSKFTPSQLTTAGAFVTGISTFLTPQPSSTGTSGKPKAFLNWILFDEQFNYVSSNSGFEAVGGNDVYTTHTQSNLPVTKNGFLYIYTSNETPNIDVFFDNLQVTHTRGQVLEETHYYPFGLTMAGISSKAAGSLENKKKYNGIELNNDFDLNIYDAFYRNLDVQIGRWWQVDPKTENQEYMSPYTSMGNDPVRYSDFLGDEQEEFGGPVPADALVVDGAVILGGAITMAGAGMVITVGATAAAIVYIATHPEILLSGGASAAQSDLAVERQLMKANTSTTREAAAQTGESLGKSGKSLINSDGDKKGSKPNNGNAKKHGGTDHDNAINDKVKELNNDANVINVRKNQQQVDATGKKVGTNRPDVQYDRYNEKTGKWEHHTIEYDTKPASSTAHGKTINKNDPKAKVELNVLK